MPRGERGTKDYFLERFGLGDRLAVRLAALLAHKVEVTAAAIECLKESAALRHAILHPDLLGQCDGLDTEALLALVLPGESLPASLAVTEGDGWRTVALEEELLAEENGADEPAEEHLPVLGGRAEVLHPSEIAELFTRRDIAELELVLRTSADANEKIEAIRKLALSPARPREKLALFAMALTDRAAAVRGEAAEALTTLGLRAEIAEDARALAEGNDRQKRFAAQRLGSRIREAAAGGEPTADLELGVVLRILAGTLRHEPSLEVRRLLIAAVEGACEAVAEDAKSTRDLIRVLIAQLRDAVEELGHEVRRVLLILGRFSPAEVYGILQGELAPIVDHATRSVVVAVAGELAGDEQRAEVGLQAVAEIMASDAPAVECLALANLLAGLGGAAVAAIEPHLTDAPEPAQEAFVRLLDAIASRPKTPRITRAAIGKLMLRALRDGARPARLAVIQSTAPMDAGVPAATRAALAAELLACLQDYANPGTIDAIETTVIRLGAPAVEPTLGVVAGVGRARVRTRAAHVLGELVARLDPKRADLARGAIDTALALVDDAFPDRAALIRAVGRMCAGPAADAETVARVAKDLIGRMLEPDITHAIIDGLASLCPSPNATQKLKVDLVDYFRRLLEREPPDLQAESVETRDETVYTLGSQVTAYTELVPSIIAGLRNIALTTEGALRRRAADELLGAWRRIADGSLQLGPGNTQQLLDAFHALGALPDVDGDLRDAIADAVALRRRDFLPTYRVLADLCVAAGPAMTDRAVALADEILARDAGDRRLTEADRATLLADLVHLVLDADLGPQAATLRERAVAAVLDADKRDNEHVLPLLGQLRDAPAIPAPLRKRIASRLPREC